MSDKKILVFLADGFEDVEALVPIDILRRAGLEVITVSVTADKKAQSAHQVTLTTDSTIDELCDDMQADALVLPGGMPGAENLFASEKLAKLLKKQAKEQRLIAAICASPGVVLAGHGLLEDKKATCYPSFERYFSDNTTHLAEPVVRDGALITAMGPAYAFDFGFAILEALTDAATVAEIKSGMLFAK